MKSPGTLSALTVICTVASRARCLALCVPVAAAAQVSIGVITQNRLGNDTTNGRYFYLGQSVTTPAGGVWDNIAFNWRDTTTAPYANGTLFLLSQAYSGSPGSLSNATPGFIAKSNLVGGGIWYFDPSIRLTGSTKYYFYGATEFDGTNEVLFSNGNPYAGGEGYEAGCPTCVAANFYLDGADYRFDLSGRALSAPVPEPSSVRLMQLGLLGIGAALRLRASGGCRGSRCRRLSDEATALRFRNRRNRPLMPGGNNASGFVATATALRLRLDP